MDSHDERLLIPVWWWPVGIAVAATLAAELRTGAGGVWAWLPYAVVVPLAVALLWGIGRTRVQVRDGQLRVGAARLPHCRVRAAQPLSAEATRRALGPELDPAGYVVHKPWIRGSVRVTVDAAADQTPYWLVSTRRPEALAAALDPGPSGPSGRPASGGGAEPGDGAEPGGSPPPGSARGDP